MKRAHPALLVSKSHVKVRLSSGASEIKRSAMEMRFKYGGTKEIPGHPRKFFVLSPDDELLYWAERLSESPACYHLLIKHVYSPRRDLFSLHNRSPPCHIEIPQRLISQKEWMVSETCGLLFCPTALCSLAGLMMYGPIHLYSVRATCFHEPPVSASVFSRDISVH